MANENCLCDMACPKCGSLGPYKIWAKAEFLVHDDGTESYSNVEWQLDDPCECVSCRHFGKVKEFYAET